MADAGFKLTVEGEKEFRQAITDINAILKLNQAELQNVTAAYNASDKGIDDLVKKQEGLEKAIYTQVGALAEMSGEYSRLKDAYGENDKGVIKLRTEIEKASATMANMDAQLAETIKAIEEASTDTADFGTKIGDAEAQIKALAAELKATEAAMDDGSESISLFGKNSDETKDKVENLKKQNELLEESIEQHKKKLDALNEEMERAVDLYGDQSREVADYRTEIADTQVEIESLKDHIKDNNDEILNAEERATSLKDVFGQIEEITGVQIPEGLTKMLGNVDALAASAAGLAATLASAMVSGTVGAIKGAEEYTADMTTMAAETNLTTQELQTLQYVAGVIGTDVNGVTDAMKDLRKNMYSAASGNQELIEEFDKLGVGIYDTNGQLRDAYDVMTDLVYVYGNITNSTERAARMQILMGENSKALNAMILAGRDALEEYRETAMQRGYVWDDEVVEKMDKAAQKTRELKLAWESFTKSVGMELGELTEATFSGEEYHSRGYAKLALDELLQTLKEKLTGKYATGTYNHPGGYAMVGENGPEIVDLPAGSRVYPNGQYPEMGATNNYYVTISASDVREFNDIVRLAQSKRVTERMQ